VRLRTPGFRRRDLTLDGAMTARLRIVRAEATDENLQVVLRLIDEAAQWLHKKGTNQWARPWPDPTSRDERVRRGLEGGKTWFVQDEAQNTLATVTIATHANPCVWPASAWADESTHNSDAVYVHRLIVARGEAGKGLGEDLFDWAGQRAAREYRAKWIRIDVWTANLDLHKYYESRGFEPAGFCADPKYPSGALFEKEILHIAEDFQPQFRDTDLSPFTWLTAGE
jgi:GNAT superfamily N-acetyltransferase